MNIFNSSKIRWSIIFLLAVLQIASVTLFSESDSVNLFYIVTLTYFALGFFSLDLRQAVKNISLVTLPVVVLITLILLFIALLGGKISGVLTAVDVAFKMWALILFVSLPIFMFGFGLRLLIRTLYIKKSK